MNAMLTRFIPVIVILAATSNNCFAQSYAVDGAHSSATFSVRHLWAHNVQGRLHQTAGTFNLDAQNPSRTTFQLTAFAESIDTKNKKRDQHLRGPDFFDCKQFPTITFTSTSVTQNGNNFEVNGELTLHGITRPTTLVLRKVINLSAPSDDQTARFESQFEIKRSDFGMTSTVGPIGDKISITINFLGTKS